MEPSNSEFNDREVFICDTEGVYDRENRGSIASLIMPLLILSTKIVVFSDHKPDDSITNFLAICKSFIKINDGNIEDPFKDKLIVRCIDLPHVFDDPEQGMNEAMSLILSSNISTYFSKHNISPTYIPAGPFDWRAKSYDPYFTEKFLNLVFSNQENSIVFSNPQKFIDDAKMINESPMSDCARILVMFKEKNFAQKLLDFICIQIEAKINDFFEEQLKSVVYDEKILSIFFQENVVSELTKITDQNKIKEMYLNEYIEIERKYFESKQLELKKRILNIKKYKDQLAKAKNLKERVESDLNYISELVQDRAQKAANLIFYNVKNHYTKITEYEYIITSNIRNQNTICIQSLQNTDIPNQIRSQIGSEINKIFDSFYNFKEFVFYRECGWVSMLLSMVFDYEEESGQKEEIAPGVFGIINKSNDKYLRIDVYPRKYNVKFNDLLNKIIENQIMEKLNSEQRMILEEYVNRNNIKFIADLTEKQINDIIQTK